MAEEFRKGADGQENNDVFLISLRGDVPLAGRAGRRSGGAFPLGRGRIGQDAAGKTQARRLADTDIGAADPPDLSGEAYFPTNRRPRRHRPVQKA